MFPGQINLVKPPWTNVLTPMLWKSVNSSAFSSFAGAWHPVMEPCTWSRNSFHQASRRQEGTAFLAFAVKNLNQYEQTNHHFQWWHCTEYPCRTCACCTQHHQGIMVGPAWPSGYKEFSLCCLWQNCWGISGCGVNQQILTATDMGKG